MPIYEYICLDCRDQFELIRPMAESDAPLACAACGGEHVRRKLAVVHAYSGGHAVTAGSPGSGGCNCGSCSGGHCGSCSH